MDKKTSHRRNARERVMVSLRAYRGVALNHLLQVSFASLCDISSNENTSNTSHCECFVKRTKCSWLSIHPCSDPRTLSLCPSNARLVPAARQWDSTLSASLGHMRPDASIYQFTYGPRCPVPRAVLERLGLRCRCVGSTLANFPPATVYRIWRRRFLQNAHLLTTHALTALMPSGSCHWTE